MRVWNHGSGSKPWRVRGVDENGRRVQQSFATRALADEFDRKTEDAKARLGAGLSIRQESITFGRLAELFIENQPAKQSDKWFRGMLKKSTDEFGHVAVRALKSDDYGRWLHSLAVAAKTKTHYLTAARQVTKAGLEWGYLDRDPLRPGAVRGPGTKRRRPIRPFESWAEVEAVCAAIGGTAHIVKFVCLTGLRPGEWLALTWADYDAESGLLHVPGTKTENAERTIPLCTSAREQIDWLPRALKSSQTIFPLDYHEWRKNVWPDALAAACLAKRVPYEMRHTFATLSLEAGLPIESVSELMGHGDIRVTLEFYAKFTRRKLEKDVALLDNITKPVRHLAATE